LERLYKNSTWSYWIDLQPHVSTHRVVPCQDRISNMNNLQQLLQMGQQLQAKVQELQQRLDSQEVSASAGGGMVKATVDGKGSIRGLRIDPAVVDPQDVEMLEDLVIAAVTEAQTKARSLYEEEMRKATGGLPLQLPGLF
jgi:nucleoid-associated protein EbfC